MLTAYLTTTQQFLQNPVTTPPLYATSDLTGYINTARTQIAIEAECIRVKGSLALSNATQSYAFSSITFSASGILAPINVRTASLVSGSTQNILDQRPWEWFNNYYYSGGINAAGSPTVWSQQGQGENGTMFFYPIPNGALTVSMDVVALPIALVDNTTFEAIPYPWTDAVPFYAAYYAFISAQRQTDADKMLERYEMFVKRARQGSTPTVLPDNNPGGPGAQMAALKSPVTGAMGGGR